MCGDGTGQQVQGRVHIGLHHGKGPRPPVLLPVKDDAPQRRAMAPVDPLPGLAIGAQRKAQRGDVGFGGGGLDGAAQRAGMGDAAQLDHMRHGRDGGVGMQAELLPEVQLGQRQRHPVGVGLILGHVLGPDI